MGILTKMLGMKIFLLLSLSVLGYSIPQPELKIIIHLHYDDFQSGPARGPEPVGRRRFEGGFDYSDEEETVDEAVIPNEKIEVGEVGEDEDGSGLDDLPVEPQAEEAGDDYHDHWTPQPYQGSYDDGAERGGNG